MLQTAPPAGGNLKLHGLLRTARELLRRRHLKKALNNAQIAEDFAARSREAPEVVVAARLLRAEILLVNAAYGHDDALRSRGRRLLDQIESDAQRRGRNPAALPPELSYVRARACLLAGEPEAAERHFRAGLDALADDPRRARFAVGLAEAAVSRGHRAARVAGATPERVGRALARAEELLASAPEYEREALRAHVCLLVAYDARDRGDLGHAIDAAHRARHGARASDHREIEALASFFLGQLSRERGNNVIALRLLYEAMDAAEDMGHRPLLVDAHLEIGRVFDALADDREAAKYLTYAADDAAESGRTEVAYAASYALGVAARRRGDLAAANARLGAALQAANALEWPREQGVVLGELAGVKLAEGEPGLAGHLAAEARRCASLAQRAASAKTALTEARLAALGGDPDRCLDLARECEASAREEGRDDLLAEALRLRSRILGEGGDAAAALAAERAAGEVTRRLLDQQRDRHLPDLNMRAALRQRDREIEKLTREAELKNALVAKTEETERANRDLVQVNEELRQFAYVASHDLKEPLRQIGSYVSLIRRDYGDRLDERGEAFFGFVTEGVTRLNRLLDSLMHYTSVARLEMRIEPVALSALVAEVEREIASQIEAAGAEVVSPGLPIIYTSGDLLRHVVEALLDNAVKFGRAGAPPRVEVSAAVAPEGYTLRVRDNGIGIDPAYADKVFVLFQMLHAKGRYPGTGVGLAIAQKTVQRLGGRISFAPNPDAAPGTTFTVELPAPPGEGELEPEIAEELPELPGGPAE